MQCPDGHTVGRTGPKCEFDCSPKGDAERRARPLPWPGLLARPEQVPDQNDVQGPEGLPTRNGTRQ